MAELSEVTNDKGLQFRLDAVTKRLGFERFLVGIEWKGPGGGRQFHISSGYSPQWQSRYTQQQYLERDPTVVHCQTSMQPMVWRNENFLSAQAMDILEDARAHRMGHGVSVGVHGKNGVKSMLSLARDQDIERNHLERAELIASAQVLSACAHLALLRIVGMESPVSGTGRITRQEREVIRWVAAGKTGWEIGRIMSISEPTVAFHVKNAMQKLEVKNRPQMVAVAFRAGLID